MNRNTLQFKSSICIGKITSLFRHSSLGQLKMYFFHLFNISRSIIWFWTTSARNGLWNGVFSCHERVCECVCVCGNELSSAILLREYDSMAPISKRSIDHVLAHFDKKSFHFSVSSLAFIENKMEVNWSLSSSLQILRHECHSINFNLMFPLELKRVRHRKGVKCNAIKSNHKTSPPFVNAFNWIV